MRQIYSCELEALSAVEKTIRYTDLSEAECIYLLLYYSRFYVLEGGCQRVYVVWIYIFFGNLISIYKLGIANTATENKHSLPPENLCRGWLFIWATALQFHMNKKCNNHQNSFVLVTTRFKAQCIELVLRDVTLVWSPVGEGRGIFGQYMGSVEPSIVRNLRICWIVAVISV